MQHFADLPPHAQGQLGLSTLCERSEFDRLARSTSSRLSYSAPTLERLYELSKLDGQGHAEI